MSPDTAEIVTTATITTLVWIAIDIFRSGTRWVKLETKHRAEIEKIRGEHRAERQAEHEKRMAEIRADRDKTMADLQRRADALERRAEIDEALLPIVRRLDKLAPRPAKQLITELETSLDKREN
jgi:regulator of protease activity HflC (stomatin/prohibitin superfamily)